MKFIRPPLPPAFTKRTVTFFAWVPFTIGRETRWLETVTVEFMFISLPSGGGCQWYPQKFLP